MAFSFADVTQFTKEARGTFADANRLPAGTPVLDALLSRGAISVQPATFNTVTMIGMTSTDKFQEFEQGESHFSSVQSFQKVVKVRNWDAGLKITRFDFDDMGNNPAGRQMYLSQIAELAVRGKRKKEDMLIDLIRGTGDYLTTDAAKNEVAYDGSAFFQLAAGRASGANTVATAGTGWDHATLRDEFDTLLETWSTQKAYKSEIKQRSSPPMSGFLVLCNPGRFRVLTEVFGAALIGSTATGTATDGVAAITNVLNEKFGVEILMHSDIPNTEYYVFDTSGMIPGVGPIVLADREPLTIEMNSPQSDSFIEGFELTAHAWFRANYTWGNWNKLFRFNGKSAS